MREYLFRGKDLSCQFVYGDLLSERDKKTPLSTNTNTCQYCFIHWKNMLTTVFSDSVGIKVATCNGENLFENQRVIIGDDEQDKFIGILKWCDYCQSVQLFTDDGEDCYNHKLNECDWDSFIHFCEDGRVRSAE